MNEQKTSIRDAIARNLPLINRINILTFFGLSITTLYTANSTALAKLDGVMGDYAYLAPVAALLIGFMVLSFFDLDLRKNFVTSLQAVFSDDWREAGRALKVVAIFFIFIACIRLALSTGATIISGSFMADDMIEEVDTDGLEKMMAEKLESKQTIAATLSEQIREIKRGAQSESDRLEKEAIESGAPKWAELWRSGNNWIRTVSGPDYRPIERWRAGIYEAQKKGDRIIADANEEARDLRKQSTAMIQAETEDPTFAAIASAKVAKVEKAQRREWLLQIGLWSLDFLFSIMALLSSFGLVIGVKCRPEYKIFRDEETTFSDVLREAIAAGKRIFVSYGVAMVAGLDAKAAQVASVLSQGTGAVDLNARAVEMRRGAYVVAPAPNVARQDATPAPEVASVPATPAPDPVPEPTSARLEPLSDRRDTVSHGSHTDIKYVDMKNHIDRITKRYRRAWAKGDKAKMRQVVADKEDGVAWLVSLGFDVETDDATGRMSVKKIS